jgi:hypothetical protein
LQGGFAQQGPAYEALWEGPARRKKERHESATGRTHRESALVTNELPASRVCGEGEATGGMSAAVQGPRLLSARDARELLFLRPKTICVLLREVLGLLPGSALPGNLTEEAAVRVIPFFQDTTWWLGADACFDVMANMEGLRSSEVRLDIDFIRVDLYVRAATAGERTHADVRGANVGPSSSEQQAAAERVRDGVGAAAAAPSSTTTTGGDLVDSTHTSLPASLSSSASTPTLPPLPPSTPAAAVILGPAGFEAEVTTRSSPLGSVPFGTATAGGGGATGELSSAMPSLHSDTAVQASVPPTGPDPVLGGLAADGEGGLPSHQALVSLAGVQRLRLTLSSKDRLMKGRGIQLANAEQVFFPHKRAGTNIQVAGGGNLAWAQFSTGLDSVFDSPMKIYAGFQRNAQADVVSISKLNLLLRMCMIAVIEVCSKDISGGAAIIKVLQRINQQQSQGGFPQHTGTRHGSSSSSRGSAECRGIKLFVPGAVLVITTFIRACAMSPGIGVKHIILESYGQKLRMGYSQGVGSIVDLLLGGEEVWRAMEGKTTDTLLQAFESNEMGCLVRLLDDIGPGGASESANSSRGNVQGPLRARGVGLDLGGGLRGLCSVGLGCIVDGVTIDGEAVFANIPPPDHSNAGGGLSYTAGGPEGQMEHDQQQGQYFFTVGGASYSRGGMSGERVGGAYSMERGGEGCGEGEVAGEEDEEDIDSEPDNDAVAIAEAFGQEESLDLPPPPPLPPPTTTTAAAAAAQSPFGHHHVRVLVPPIHTVHHFAIGGRATQRARYINHSLCSSQEHTCSRGGQHSRPGL